MHLFLTMFCVIFKALSVAVKKKGQFYANYFNVLWDFDLNFFSGYRAA
jgi:hypothetical protein